MLKETLDGCRSLCRSVVDVEQYRVVTTVLGDRAGTHRAGCQDQEEDAQHGCLVSGPGRAKLSLSVAH